MTISSYRPTAKRFGHEGETVMTFDYSLPAELYLAKRGGGQRKPLQYRCFPTAAEAIRFAVEDFPSVPALGAWMQVGRARFDGKDIRLLYESTGYPLRRRAQIEN